MTSTQHGISAGVHHGDNHIAHVHGAKRVVWPVVVGQIPAVAAHFQHRREEERLNRVASEHHAVVLGQVLTGMGGVGKTQLAAHHAHTLLKAGQVDLVVWIPAAARSQVVQTYAQAAHDLLDGTVADDPERAALQFLGWLQTTDKRWLVVLDNLDDPAQAQNLWPPTTPVPASTVGGHSPPWWRRLLPLGSSRGREGAVAGRVVVTTRRADLLLPGPEPSLINVGLYEPAESRHYLVQALRTLRTPPTEQELDELARELGHLPLALAHAAAYLRARAGSTTCAGYLTRFADHQRTLHRSFPEENLPEGYPATVATTWKISIEYADTLPPQGLSRPLMRLVSLLDPIGIPLTVLTSQPVLGYLAESTNMDHTFTAEDVVDALDVLRRLHLITVETDEPSTDPLVGGSVVTVHRLVQRATRDDPDLRPDPALAIVAANALLQEWSNTVHATVHGQRLRSNTTVLVSHAEDWLWEPDAHPVLFRAGASLGESGAVAQAIDYWKDMNKTAIQRLGADHPDTLDTRNNLASWRGEGGDVAGAVAESEVLLEDRVRVLGADHPDTLVTRSNLAGWRGEGGDVAGAVAEFEVLLEDRVRVLGADHPDTLVTRSNLASWRGEGGDVAGAVAEFEALLEVQVRVLGADYLATLVTRNNLASWRGHSGDVAGAVAGFEALLEDQVRVLGADHPDTLITRSNLAFWRGEGGDVAEFEVLLEDRVRVLGADHPDTLTTRNNLAFWRGEGGDVAGAVAEFEALLEVQVRVLGADHPDTLTTRNNLAFWRGHSGDVAGAVAESEALLEDRVRVLGADHPATLVTRNNLASWRGEGGDVAGAMVEFEALLEDRVRVLGADHPATLTTRNNLAFWRAEGGDVAGAVAEFEALLEAQLRVLGADHPDTLTTQHTLEFFAKNRDR
ncbi:tetratricopeptide repeat protein [Nocardiopsis dassonvillei]